LGTVLRALAHGVPLLMLPLGRDQHFNAGRVSQLAAGVDLALDASPEEIRQGLERLTIAPGFCDAAEAAAARIAADEPDRSAVQAVEAVAGSSRRRHAL
jgi:UDP:flavonoid glycosyltransferase YjiC (YdhE family)